MTQIDGVIDLDSVENEIVRAGITYWRQLKGNRSYPSRQQIKARELGGLFRNLVLVAVINGGEEYEFRIYGDTHTQATGFNMQGGQLRDVNRVWPSMANSMKKVYGRVVETRQPIALRTVRARPGDNERVLSEHLLLPVGKNDSGVDHIMVFSAYRLADLPGEPPAC